MARRSKSKSKKGRRDNLPIANNPLLPFLMEDIPLITYEDRRAFTPSTFPVSFPQPTKIRVRKKPRVYQHSLKKNLSKANKHALAFEFHAPDNVLICVRRKRRKEVLHALNKTGRGRGKQKKPRRNFYSDIQC